MWNKNKKPAGLDDLSMMLLPMLYLYFKPSEPPKTIINIYLDKNLEIKDDEQ